VIIKSNLLGENLEAKRADRDYSYADEKEVESTDLAREALKEIDVKVPEIYFAANV
jgi:hypothetical protein